VYVIYTLIAAGIKGGKILLDRMIVFIILLIFNVIFWACFEQAGTSLTLFAERNVERTIFTDFTISAPTTQFFNPAFILLFGSLFSIMWIKLTAIKRNPSIPMKFALAMIQLGIGYLMIQAGSHFAYEYMVPLTALILLYLLHTTGELFISPIGLSMVTKLAPPQMTATIMGSWFLSWAGANYFAALLARATGDAGAIGETISKAESLSIYLQVFTNIGVITILIGVLLIFIARPLNKLMHGIE
jgi:POT family proton-dependent oligopeptide transporter